MLKPTTGSRMREEQRSVCAPRPGEREGLSNQQTSCVPVLEISLYTFISTSQVIHDLRLIKCNSNICVSNFMLIV